MESLLRKVLWYLGIPVRSRSVERFQTAYLGDKAVAEELPIHVHYDQRAPWIAGIVLFLIGLGAFLSPIWWPQAAGDAGPAHVFGSIGMLIGLIIAAYRQPKLCEISQGGIRTPGGFWGRLRFVPWEELVRFEIIHDDDQGMSDYFVLWDRQGRLRVDARSWIKHVRPSDRARILHALRVRFPEKAQADSHEEPLLVGPASSSLWDRELDD
jgi:hypothetical protein